MKTSESSPTEARYQSSSLQATPVTSDVCPARRFQGFQSSTLALSEPKDLDAP